MLNAFNTLVKPSQDELDKLLTHNLEVTEDFTIIPINIRTKLGELVRVYENGILIECYHETVTKNNCNDCGEFVG